MGPRTGSVRKTGVFATKEEIEKVRALGRNCASAPVVKVHGHWLPDDAQAAFEAGINAIAYAHGLPELRLKDGAINNYGMLFTGEITAWDEDGEG